MAVITGTAYAGTTSKGVVFLFTRYYIHYRCHQPRTYLRGFLCPAAAILYLFATAIIYPHFKNLTLLLIPLSNKYPNFAIRSPAQESKGICSGAADLALSYGCIFIRKNHQKRRKK